MSRGLFIAIYGLGGNVLDPAGGEATINAKAAARDLTVHSRPYDYTAWQAIVSEILAYTKAEPGKPIFAAADSCGANILPFIMSKVPAVSFELACMIQASMYCNNSPEGGQYPPIKKNCRRALVYYSSFALTGGLGCFQPQPETTPPKPQIVANGWHVMNGGSTLYQAIYRPAPHPDDQDPIIHGAIFAVVDGVLNEGQS
jgi:hypothetical protein